MEKPARMNGRVLVTGGTGFIGKAVLKRLSGFTHPAVRLLLHHSVPDPPLPEGVEYAYADLARPETLDGVCDGVDTVLHFAGYIGDDEEQCDVVNARGTEELVARARTAGVRCFIYVSNAAVYGYAVHRNNKETDVTVHPATPISRSRVRAERAVLGLDGVVLRPLFVYGTGDTHFLPILIRALDRFPFLINGGRARLSVITVDDLAAVLVALATGECTEEHRGVFHVNDGHPVSVKEIVITLARCMGTRLPSFSVSFWIARIVIHMFGGRIFQKAGQRSLTHRLFLVSKDHYYDASKLWDLVSARPGPPLSERLPQYANWYRQFLCAERERESSMSLRHHRLRVSKILSLLLNPSVMTGVFFCLLAAKFEPPGSSRVFSAVISVIFTSLVPVGMLFVLKASGKLSDVEMSIRSERDRVYWLCTAGYGLGVGLLLLSGASWPLWGLLAWHIPNTLVLIVFNRWLKVSVHTVVLTSLYMGALMFLGTLTAPTGVLVLAAAWARWDAGNHSIAELMLGMLIGGVLTPIEIYALRTAFGG
jgi:nucleoside-diphosphate-sugar epimerase